MLDGRDFVLPEDVKRCAVAALAHRMTLTAQAWASGIDPAAVVQHAVAEVAGPPVVGRAVAG